MMDDKDLPQKKTYSAFLLLSIVLTLIFIVAVLMPVEPSDYWTYLRIGDEILKTGQIPQSEFMTYTQAGAPAAYSYWLSSLMLLGLYQSGGLTLSLLAAGLCICALYVFVWCCLRWLKLGAVSASLLLLIIAMMGSNNWSIRPQIFAYPLFGLTLWILLKWQQQENRLLWLIPAAVLLWTNLHGSFILVFLLIGSALIFGTGSRKKLLIVLLACAAATLVNPYGFGIWTNMGSMIGSDLIRNYSVEWAPPTNAGWQLNLFFGSLLAIPVLTAYSPQKGGRLSWVWFLGFGWMALSSVRYVIWFSAVEALLLAQLAFPWFNRFLDRKAVFSNKVFNLVLATLMLVSSLAFLPGIRHGWWPQAPATLTDYTPVQAVEWLKQHPELPGEQWSNWAASIYMSWAIPERRVWITNRIEDFTEEQILDNQRLSRPSYDWQEILDSYDVNLLLLSRVYDAPLLGVVSSSTLWHEVYRDEQSVIFTR